MIYSSIVFDRLPIALFRVISQYTNLSTLFTTCKGLWNGEERKEVIYLSLKDNVAMRFALDDTFRNYIYSRVQFPSMQISLKLSHCDVTDVSALWNVHTLILRYCSGKPDVSALGKVHTLLLWNCSKIADKFRVNGVNLVMIRSRIKKYLVSSLKKTVK